MEDQAGKVESSATSLRTENSLKPASAGEGSVMKKKIFRSKAFWNINRGAWALLCVATLLPAEPGLLGYSPQESAAPPEEA